MRRVVFMVGLLFVAGSALAQTCPEPLASARRVVLVTADSVNTSLARLQRFEREATTQPWRSLAPPHDALIGRNGMAWAPMFRSFARTGEPVKIEGDRRAPA